MIRVALSLPAPCPPAAPADGRALAQPACPAAVDRAASAASPAEPKLPLDAGPPPARDPAVRRQQRQLHAPPPILTSFAGAAGVAVASRPHRCPHRFRAGLGPPGRRSSTP